MTLYEITETYTAGIQPQQHIVYPSPQHINQPAINLLAALKGELTNIPGANDHILHDGIGQKTSIVINIPGYRPYKEPRNVTCVQDGVKVQKPQSGVMGETARATQSFIDKADTLRVLEGPGGILFGPGHLELKDLWLLRLVRVSKGAYQAVLGIQVDDEAQLDLGVPPAPAPTPAAGFPDDTPAYAPADPALVEHVWDSLVQNVIATEASHPNAYATLPLQLAAFLNGGEDAAGYLANYNYPGPYQFLADYWKGWSGDLAPLIDDS